MERPIRTLLATLALAAAITACTAAPGGSGGGAPGTGAQSPGAPSPVDPSFDTFAAEQCAALQAMFVGYGNPDTAGLSPLMRSFADAIDQGDAGVAAAKAAEIRSVLEDGRGHARVAAAWTPSAVAMAQLDRLLVAFERMVDARLASLPKGPVVAERDGQAAFEGAGGVDAWYGWAGAVGDLLTVSGRSLPECEGVPIS